MSHSAPPMAEPQSLGDTAHSASADLPADFRKILSDYRQSSLWSSLWQLSVSVGALVGIWTAMWFSLQYSYWLTLLLALPLAGFMVRLFILQHDCGHGSFFASRRINDFVGRALSVLTLTPYQRWRRGHAVHHATSGDLDRRGFGDIHMLTVAEYLKLSRWQKFSYRLQRNPWILFGIGPFLYFVVFQRFAFYEPATWKKERISVYCTNIALLIFWGGLGWLVGYWELLLIQLPPTIIASSAGVWLFYVQHHFEAAYWQPNETWDYFDAGLAGSSYYELPKVLQWFTANIALHHIHHLDSQIPNYRLQACFDENPSLQKVKRITLRESFACASLKLWDEAAQKMVGYPRA
ncbi:MAG: fatty acid desaturase [Planctomycetes bacterium]|nr:fatty acid desaturase [Planctomycetota bacterium]